MDQGISAAEGQVMRVVWAHPGETSQYIIHSLADGFDWQAATIKTLLGRLRKKGYLRMDKEGGSYRYYPLIGEKEHLSGQLASLLENMCSTKHGSLVLELLEMGQFTQGQLKDIEQKLLQKGQLAPEKLSCHCLPGQCSCGCHH